MKLKIELNGIEEAIKTIRVRKELTKDIKFRKYIKNKCMKALKDVMRQRLVLNIDNYEANNKIADTEDGFIIYNDTMADLSELSDDTKQKYPDGFSVALAIEYGTGIVGQDNPKKGAWEYNLNEHVVGWSYYKNGRFYGTRGIEGMEIYRFTSEKIANEYKSWVIEYISSLEENK